MAEPVSGPGRERHGSTPDDILATKLRAPRPGPHLVPRPGLFARLTAGTRGPLTLVCAPAGYGKTSLVVGWHAAVPPPRPPLAWVSLDADDADPIRFGTHLLHALGGAHPGLGERTLAWLRAPQPPPLRAVLGPVVNELGALSTDLVLVLDDYDAVASPAVDEALVFLLDHAPPQLHVVLLAREDPPLPLARYRARGVLVELRQADLRFAADEAADFVAGVAGLRPDPDALHALTDRTEGWAVGLQLAAIALRGHADAAGFVRTFAGTHRYVMDYLVEEVLGRQPAHIQAFLLETAILEQLTASLCMAVTGRADSAALLAALERANLFVVPLDDERRWYRYHRLFADLLRARLHHVDPARIVELHRSAGAWYEREGLTDRAIRHALAAGDVGSAARLVEQVADATWMRGESVALARWLDALPKDLVRARPRLGLLQAWTRLLTHGWSEAVDTGLRQAETAIGPDGQHELAGVAETIRAVEAVFRWDTVKAADLTRQALSRLPAASHTWRGIATTNQAMVDRLGGDLGAASRTFVAAERLTAAAGNHYAALVATANLAHGLALRGRLREAREGYERALAFGGNQPLPLGSARVGLGRVLCEQNERDAARRHLDEGIAAAALEDDEATLAFGYRARSRLLWADGDGDGAAAALAEAERLMRVRGIPSHATSDLVTWHPARLALMRGEPAEAMDWAARSGLAANDSAQFTREVEQVTFARVLIARGESDDALALLARVRAAAEAGDRVARVVETLAVQVAALAAQGKAAAALGALARALALAEPAGYLRLLVDEGHPLHALLRRAEPGPYVDRLLAAYGDGSPQTESRATEAETGLDPLTRRERDVLRLIAAGLSAAEIAERLFLSAGSVKWHTNNVYQKLSVHNRVQATARARELGLR